MTKPTSPTVKPVHTETVPCRWTARDAKIRADAPEVLPDDPGLLRAYYLTPYLVLPRVLPGDKEIAAGDLVMVPLARSHERWSVDRFFEGITWEPIPPQITGYSTIGDLCAALYAFSKDRYPHLNLAAQANEQKNQTAKLIFDSWENTEYRYATVKSGFDWEILKDRTFTLAAEHGGVKILRVPTRPATQGKIIKAVPAPKPPEAQKKPKPDDPRSRIVVEPDAFFSVAVSFTEASDGALTPLSGGQWRQSKLRFTIKIGKLKTRAQADETIVRVVKPDGTVLLEESHTGDDLVKPGDHVWEWDGYSSAGVFDTKVLKTADLTVEVRVIALPGKAAVASAALRGAAPADWVDVRINEPSKRVLVEVFLVPLKRFTSSISDGDFRLVMSMIEEGIAKHWSHTITAGGDLWTVDVAARFRKSHGIEYTIIETDDPRARSCNLRVVTTSLSIWFYYCATVSLQEQRETAAHEFGHSILGTVTAGTPAKGVYGTHHSLTHKGSSTEWQSQEGSAPSYPAAPAECDVMIYYNGRKTFDVYDRCFGVEDDLKHLISLAQVQY